MLGLPEDGLVAASGGESGGGGRQVKTGLPELTHLGSNSPSRILAGESLRSGLDISNYST